jgi:nucleotidyltransferase/DNA polymerase involved in DNA repair
LTARLIIDCTPAASAAGVRPGMPVTAALGLLGDLHIAGRDREAERQALQRLAAWCYQYSSQVCIPGDRIGLLIEAGASGRLFGRPEDLGRRLARELGRLGYHAVAGSAPTPEAAWLAAREGLHITGADELRRQLGPLPLQRLHLEPAQLTAMERMGFRQLRDLLRLPRKALTRRFGPAVSDYLDRLLGARADPRALYQPPETFSSRLDLPAEIVTSQALLFPLRRLLESLQASCVAATPRCRSRRSRWATRIATADTTRPGRSHRPRTPPVCSWSCASASTPAAARWCADPADAPRLLKFARGQHSLFRDTPAERQQDIEHWPSACRRGSERETVSGLTEPRTIAGIQLADPRAERTAALRRPRPSSAWLLPQPPLRHRKLPDPGGPGAHRKRLVGWPAIAAATTSSTRRPRRHTTFRSRPGWYLHGVFA